MNFSRRIGTKFGLYFIGPLCLNTVGLISIPLLIHNFGEKTWGELIFAQTVGTLLALIIDLGYSNFAPAFLATLPQHKRMEYYAASLKNRLSLFSLISIFLAVLYVSNILIISNIQLILIFSFASQGLSPSWLYVSMNDATGYFQKIMLPRILGNLLGACSSLLTHSVYPYLICVALGNTKSISPFFWVTIHNTLKWRDYFYGNSKNRYGPQIRINYPNSIIANLFQQLPVLILGSIGSKYFTQIAIADKVVKSLAGLTWPIVAILQGKGSGLDRKLFKTKSLVRLQIAIGLIAAFFLFPCACYLLINILKVGSSMFSKFDYGLMGLLAFLIFLTSVQSNFSMVLKRRTLKLLYVNIFSLMLLTLITFACGDSFRFSNYYVALVIIYLLHNLFLLYFSYR